VLVAGPGPAVEALEAVVLLGKVGGSQPSLAGELSVPVAELWQLYEGALRRLA
jgi:hypothetical protein